MARASQAAFGLDETGIYSAQKAGGALGRRSGPVMEALEPRVMLSVTPLITALEDSVMAGSAVHVRASDSNFDGLAPQSLKYVWNFGDVVNGKAAPYNQMSGFNAAHVYDIPGTYDISLGITDPSGNTVTTTQQVTVSADTRQKIYVAASGSDAHNGSSPALAVATAAKAQQLLNADGDNTELLFHRGDSFSLSSALSISHSNVLIGAYGTGDRPLLNWTSTGGNVLSLGSGVSNVTIQDLSADTPALANQLGESGAPFVTGNGGTDITLRNCELLNVGYGFNGNGNPDGVLMQGNVAPLAGGLRGYLAWIGGSDWVIVGNDVANSTREAVIAGGTVSRVNVSDNDLTNIDRRSSGDSGDYAKQTVMLDGVTWGYAGGNYLTGGQVTVGWTSSLSAQTNIVEDNDIADTTIQIGTGADGTRLSNNVIHYSTGASGANGISVAGYANGRGVDGLAVDHNTVLAPTGDPTGYNPAQFMSLQGSATGVSITNNLYNPVQTKFGYYGSAGLWLNVSDTSAMTLGNNVWGPSAHLVGNTGYHRMLNAGGSEIWLSPAQWQALVPTDTFPANLNNPGTAGAGTLAPKAPADLTATGGAGQIALAWDAAANATTYNLYRDAGDGTGYRLWQSGLTATTYTDTAVNANQQYAYKVSAVNTGGEGRLSEEAAGVASAPTNAAPTNLSATPGDGQVKLTWDAVAGADSYNVYHGIAADGEGATPVATGVTNTTFIDIGLINGAPYFYNVTAVNAGGESLPSNEASATPQPAVLAVPANLTATAGDGEVTLTWDAATGADSYNIYCGLTPGGEGTTPWRTGVTDTTYTDVRLLNGTSLYYTMTAVNGLSESAPSNEVSATPQAPIPATPANVTAEAGDSQVTLNWDVVPDATGYNIYCATTSGSETLLQSGITNTSFTDTGLMNDLAYYYTVTATTSGGESTPSAETSATPQAPASPAAPTNLTTTIQSATQIDLSWAGGSDDIAGYMIERSADDGRTWTALAAVDGSQNTYSDTSLDAATSYSYRVTATGGGGDSDPSQPTTPATPGGVSNFNASASSSTEIDLTWSGGDGWHLELEMKGPEDDNFHVIPLASSIGATPNESYSFRLRADRDGQVVYTSANATTPPEAPPDDPDATLDAPTNVSYEDSYKAVFDSGYGSGTSFSPYLVQGEFKALDDPYGVIPKVNQMGGVTKNEDGRWQANILNPGPITGVAYAGSIRVSNPDTGEVSPWSDPIGFTYPGTRTAAPHLSPPQSIGGGQVSLTVSVSQYMAVTIYRVEAGEPREGSAVAVGYSSVSTEQSVTLAAGPTGSRFFAVGYAYPTAPSRYSNFVDATGEESTTPPAAPANLSATPHDDGQQISINLLWDNVPNNETQYVIERSTDGQTFAQLAEAGADTSVYSDATAQSDTPYTYRVKATNSAGDSTYATASAEITLPTVTIKATDPNANEDGDSGEFTITRSGGSTGNKEPLIVKLDKSSHGQNPLATEGSDYKALPDTVTIPAGQDSVKIKVMPIDDTIAEGIEKIPLGIQSDDAHYKSDPNNYAVVLLDDNVSVQSIEVIQAPFNDDGVRLKYASAYGYYFQDIVIVKGEHLDKVQIHQMIESETTVWDFDGAMMSRNQVLSLYNGSDPAVVDSDQQYVQDTGWGWQSLVNITNANGVGYMYDLQSFPVRTKLSFSPDGDINWTLVREGYVSDRTVEFKTEVREAGDTQMLLSHPWGYTWDNRNSLWTVFSSPPNVFGDYGVIDQVGGHGEFSSVYGIEGIPW